MMAAGLGWILRDLAIGHANLSASWNGLLSVLSAIAPVVLGALVGALGAYIVALANRNEAREARFLDNKLALATDVIVQADIHAREVRQQVASIQAWSIDKEQQPPGAVGTTEPVRRAYVALDLLDHELGRKGEAIYIALVAMDTYTEPLRLRADGLDFMEFDDRKFGELINAYFVAMSAFTDYWRSKTLANEASKNS
jgi:hypothetical protein